MKSSSPQLIPSMTVGVGAEVLTEPLLTRWYPSLLNFHFLYINPKSLIPSLISLHLGSAPRGWRLHRPVVHQVVSQAEGCTHWWSELLLWGWSLLIFKIFMTPRTTVWEAYGMCEPGSFEKTRVLITRDSELANQALVRCHISSMSSHKVCTNNRALCPGDNRWELHLVRICCGRDSVQTVSWTLTQEMHVRLKALLPGLKRQLSG